MYFKFEMFAVVLADLSCVASNLVILQNIMVAETFILVSVFG